MTDDSIASFRFDCFGFGDSDGESVDATVLSQINDINCAIDKFVELSGVDTVLLAGVRFGAALAALTAENNPKVSGLALISPVVDGLEFWQQQVRNQQMQYVIRGEKAPTTESVREALEKHGRVEFEGGWFSSKMVQQIESICLTKQSTDFRGLVGFCDLSEQPAGEVLKRYKQAKCRTFVGGSIDKPFWNGKILYYPVEQNAIVHNIISWVTEIESNSKREACLGKQSA